LIPKKAKLFIEAAAAEANVSIELMSTIIEVYWKAVRTNITDLNHESLMIHGLGKFKVKHWKIDEVIVENKEAIKKLEARFEGRFKVYNQQRTLEHTVEQLEKIKEGVNIRKEKFKQIREKRNASKTNNNMEEQGPDTSGLPEQDL
jgi:hypothetical protein